jgi:hypothetical protein
MRKLMLASVLAVVATTAAAQDFMLSSPFRTGPIPQTIRLHDGRQIVGTGIVTHYPNEVRIVIRLNNGELLGTQVLGRDGKKTFYDVNGVESAPPTFKYEAEAPKEPELK